MNDIYYMVLVSDVYMSPDSVQMLIRKKPQIFFRKDTEKSTPFYIVCQTFSNGYTHLGPITLHFYFEPLGKNFIKGFLSLLSITGEMIPHKAGTSVTCPFMSI